MAVPHENSEAAGCGGTGHGVMSVERSRLTRGCALEP